MEDGNFQHFINWKSNFDNTLNTLCTNATYMSPTIQNELIECCGADIVGTNVWKINQAKYFSVLADETFDVCGTEQLSVCIRYISNHYEIQEEVQGFCPPEKQNAGMHHSFHCIAVKPVGIPFSFLWGQGYDGASTIIVVIRRLGEVQQTGASTTSPFHSLSEPRLEFCSDPWLLRCPLS